MTPWWLNPEQSAYTVQQTFPIDMNNRQTNKLNMYKAVERVCHTHAGLFFGLVAIQETLDEISTKLVRINSVAAVQSTNIQGFTADKQSFRERIVEMALQISGAVSAYAVKHKNNQLKQAVTYHPSDFKRAKDHDVVNFAQIIHDQAKANLDALKSYSINEDLLGQLQTDIHNYGNLIGARRQRVGDRVAATQDLDALFADTDLLLDEVLDGLMYPFRRTQPTFYASYLNARKVIGLGKRSKSEVPAT